MERHIAGIIGESYGSLEETPAQIASFAKKSGKSKKEVERLWNKAKKLAAEQGREEDWPYIVGILKRMLGIN